MNFDLGLFREGQGIFESILDCDDIIFGTYCGGVDERDHDALHSDRACVVEETRQFLDAFVALLRCAAQQRFIHEIVGADGTNGNSGGVGEALQSLNSRRIAQRIYIMAVEVVDPLNVVERNFGRVGKLALPVLAGEALEAAIFGGHESPFHDSELGHCSLRERTISFIELAAQITLSRVLRSCYSRTRRDRARATNLPADAKSVV